MSSSSGRGRVLVVLHEESPGGASISLMRCVPGLEERGWEFSFFVPRPGKLFDELRERGYRVSGAPRTIVYSLRALRLDPGPHASSSRHPSASDGAQADTARRAAGPRPRQLAYDARRCRTRPGGWRAHRLPRPRDDPRRPQSRPDTARDPVRGNRGRRRLERVRRRFEPESIPPPSCLRWRPNSPRGSVDPRSLPDRRGHDRRAFAPQGYGPVRGGSTPVEFKEDRHRVRARRCGERPPGRLLGGPDARRGEGRRGDPRGADRYATRAAQLGHVRAPVTHRPVPDRDARGDGRRPAGDRCRRRWPP